MWRIGGDAVVAQVPAARKVPNRLDLDRGHAKGNQMAELAYRGPKGALRRKGPDVQLVDNRLFPGAAAPAGIAPDVGPRVDHLARPVHILRLIARGRVGNAQAVRKHEAISRAGAGAIGHELVPTLAHQLHSRSP